MDLTTVFARPEVLPPLPPLLVEDEVSAWLEPLARGVDVVRVSLLYPLPARRAEMLDALQETAVRRRLLVVKLPFVEHAYLVQRRSP